MKFGAVADHLLKNIDLHLPDEPFINTLILPGIKAQAPKVYVGASTWGSSAWAGKIFPPKTPASKYRQLYPHYFNSIELNATHYNIYSPQIIQQWAAPAQGLDFTFCPKFPQQISHYSHFKNAEATTGEFLDSISALGENLGPTFLQVSENYAPANKDALFQYLSQLPKNFSIFLEVRHPAWFNNDVEKENLFNVLRQLSIGAVITDAPGRRDVVHMNLTVPKLFLRFVCNALHPTSFSRTDEWVRHIAHWLNEGMEEVYIFLHPGNDAAVPELANYWVQALNKQCGLHLKMPMIQQSTLF